MRNIPCRVPGMIVTVYSRVRSVVLVTVAVLNFKCRRGKDGVGDGVGMDSFPVEASPWYAETKRL